MKNIKFLFALGGFLIINSCAQQTLPKSQSDFALIVSGVNADAELPSTYASQSCSGGGNFPNFIWSNPPQNTTGFCNSCLV